MAGEAGDGTATPGGTGGTSSPFAFRGITQLALDAKGRLAIPAKHRDTLTPAGDGRLVLTADSSRCLLLYPLAAWEPIQARLMALSSFNEKIRALQRLLVGHADDVEHVVLVGQGQKFELWDEAQWQVETAQAIAFPADGLPPELDGFSL